jgi:predicted nucleic-acid-binding protein
MTFLTRSRLQGQEGPQLIGVDTNVLFRLCGRKAALGLLAGAPAAAVRVPVIVFAQLTSTLLRCHRLDKAALIATVESPLSRVELNVEGRSAVIAALRWYRRGTADFADYRAALNRQAGAAPTYTFDQQAASRPAFAQVS